MNELKTLAKDCDFKIEASEQHKSKLIRDQRLLEHKTLDLQTAIDQARSLDVAQQSSTVFSQPSIPGVIAPIPR